MMESFNEGVNTNHEFSSKMHHKSLPPTISPDTRSEANNAMRCFVTNTHPVVAGTMLTNHNDLPSPSASPIPFSSRNGCSFSLSPLRMSNQQQRFPNHDVANSTLVNDSYRGVNTDSVLTSNTMTSQNQSRVANNLSYHIRDVNAFVPKCEALYSKSRCMRDHVSARSMHSQHNLTAASFQSYQQSDLRNVGGGGRSSTTSNHQILQCGADAFVVAGASKSTSPCEFTTPSCTTNYYQLSHGLALSNPSSLKVNHVSFDFHSNNKIHQQVVATQSVQVPTSSDVMTLPNSLGSNQKPVKTLSAYNFFYRHQRERILNGNFDNDDSDNDYSASKREALLLDHWYKDRTMKRPHRKSHGRVSFAMLSRMVAQKWKTLPDHRKDFYKDLAIEDMNRYRYEMLQYEMGQYTFNFSNMLNATTA